MPIGLAAYLLVFFESILGVPRKILEFFTGDMAQGGDGPKP